MTEETPAGTATAAPTTSCSNGEVQEGEHIERHQLTVAEALECHIVISDAPIRCGECTGVIVGSGEGPLSTLVDAVRSHSCPWHGAAEWTDDEEEWVCQAHGMAGCTQSARCVAALAGRLAPPLTAPDPLSARIAKLHLDLVTALEYLRRAASRPSDDPLVLEMREANEAEIKRILAALSELLEEAHSQHTMPTAGTGGIAPSKMSFGIPFSMSASVWPGLAKLNEECGEVVQIIGKLMATAGETSHWSGVTLGKALVGEMGDLQAAIQFVRTHNALPNDEIDARVASKLALFETWHTEGTTPADAVPSDPVVTPPR